MTRLPVLRLIFAHPRLFIGVAIGTLVFLLLPDEYVRHTRALIGFDAGVLFFLLSTWTMMARAPEKSMQSRAKAHDEGKWLMLILSMVAAVTALLAIGFEIHGAKDLGPDRQIAHIGLAIATILLSWGFIHTVFALHYAHEHFQESNDRSGLRAGLIFPGDAAPCYIDFLYFSFVIGMTGQTSDVAVASSEMRLLALIQGVTAFFFNTTILALTINIAAGLI
jgi:uncharacterized membrane protein